MRHNSPVTQREYALPPGQTLVSVTDLKGRITYCNAAFVEVSGFGSAELLGQPHNIVRHPDMPEEATSGRRLRPGCHGRGWSRTGARTATTTGCARTRRR